MRAARIPNGALAGAVMAALLASACGDDQVPAATLGEEIFADIKLSTSPFNSYSCATCHQVRAADQVDPEERIDPGYNLFNVVHRPSWWGGYETRLLDALNDCLEDFMGGAALKPEDPRARQLYEYLLQNSPDPAPAALPLTVVKMATDLTERTGDGPRGRAVYANACRRCHSELNAGLGRAVPIPRATKEAFPAAEVRAAIVEKVRHGRYFNFAGTMPLYSAEALSDQQLADLLTYMGL